MLSREPEVIQCRIEGGLRPAEGSKCCSDDYSNCAIWRMRQELERQSGVQRAHSQAALAERHRHAMDLQTRRPQLRGTGRPGQ